MKRNLVPAKYKWDLSAYAKDEDDFLKRTKALQKYAELFKSFEGKLADDKMLLKLLNLTSEYSKEVSLLGNYAQRKLDENLADSKASENVNLLSKICSDNSVASSFITPEISQFSDDKLQSLMQNRKFKAHRLYFRDILRDRPHILPKNEEKLLSGMGEFLGGFSENHDNFSDADLKFKDVLDGSGKAHKFTQDKYSLYMHSKDRVLRANAFAEQNGAYGRFINFLSSNYLSDVKADCYFSKIHNYSSALEAAVLSEEASIDVYNNLIACVHKNLPTLYAYFDAKCSLLGYKDFYIYDQFASVSKVKEQKYSYDDAIKLIKKAVAPLGKEYVALIDKAKKEKWIDLMPNDGKAGGAYSASAYGANPVVLTNFTGDYNSVSTLAHELGHAMHSYFSETHQIFEESGYVIFVAEVASTVNEMLLRLMMLKNTSTQNEKRSIIDGIFTDVKSTIFRQTMFAEFEEWVHAEYEKGNPLSKDKLCEKYYDLNKLYFGKRVKLTKETQYEWARIPHFYRSFYVYKYATGLISALNIVSRILNGEEGAVEKYLNFLKSGCTSDPITLLKNAGCDLEKQSTFDEVFDFLRTLLVDFK